MCFFPNEWKILIRLIYFPMKEIVLKFKTDSYFCYDLSSEWIQGEQINVLSKINAAARKWAELNLSLPPDMVLRLFLIYYLRYLPQSAWWNDLKGPLHESEEVWEIRIWLSRFWTNRDSSCQTCYYQVANVYLLHTSNP